MRGSTSLFTSTSVAAGRLSPKYAMRRGLMFGRSVMSVMNTCTFTTCSGPAPAALRHWSINAIARSDGADDVSRNAAACRLSDNAGDPDVGVRAGDVAIGADQPGPASPRRGN